MKLKTFLPLVCALLWLAPMTRAAQAPVSFTGTWKTVAGGGNTPFTVVLQQTGDKLTGTYSPYDGKIFDGVVVGNKATFKWTQDGGHEGTGEWTMDEDGKGFMGTATSLKPNQFTHNWSTPRLRPSSFGGKWDTTASGKNKFLLNLQQTGDKVTGTFTPFKGTLEGTVKGKLLRFTWSNTGGKGSGRFVMNEDEQSFSGTFNMGDDPDEVDATWNGKKLTWFAGKWKAEWRLKFGDQEDVVTYNFTFEQIGDQVKGQYTTNIAGGKFLVLQNVVLTEKTLRFKLVDAEGKEFGEGEFVMQEDEKTFKGNIVGIELTGVREAE